MIVAKFGGGAMATSDTVKQVIEMILADKRRRIVVVSAPGKRPSVNNDIKVTDLLIACSAQRDNQKECMDLVHAISDRYREIARGLNLREEIVSEFDRIIQNKVTGDFHDFTMYMDRVKALGEEMSARFLAAALNEMGVKAQFTPPEVAGMLVTSQYGNAQPLPEAYHNLARLKKQAEKAILVFPGFYGITREGSIATFSRGGSDLTGSVLAAAVGAEVYENFTDVPGIFCTNPAYLTQGRPRKIERLTFQELRELSYSGFSVFHDEAILPVMVNRKPIPIHLRDFRYPDKQGTWITGEREYMKGRIIGIAADGGFISFTVCKNLMNREIGLGRRLLGIFEEKGLSYDHSPSGIDSISVILKHQGKLDDKMITEIKDRIYRDLEADSVKVETGLAMLAIVGLGMNESIGIAAKATAAISKAKVNIEMISQGASEISIFYAVKEEDISLAVTSLYNSLIRYARTPYLKETYKS